MIETDTPVEPISLTLRQVMLAELHFRNRQLEMPVLQAVQISWQSQITVGVAHAVDHPDQVRVRAELTVTYPDDGSPQPFDIKVALVGFFEAPRPLLPEELVTIAQGQSLRALWPYLQENVLNVTSRAGGPPFVLPPEAPALGVNELVDAEPHT